MTDQRDALSDKARSAVAEGQGNLGRPLGGARQQLELFVEHAPAAIAMFDREMRYILASRRWSEELGLTAQNIVGLRHYDLFPSLPARWKEAHARCLNGEILEANEDSFEHNGRTEWVRWEIQPWRDAHGAIGGLIIFAEFITRQKDAEAALAANQRQLEERVAERTRELSSATARAQLANEQKSAFLNAASHDLRQPLQAATAYLSVIQARAGVELAPIAAKALSALDVANDILSALLDLSSLNAGAVLVRAEEFPVQGFLERLVLQFQTSAVTSGIDLLCKPSNLTLRTDARLLERVVANYVANAVRYTSRGLVELGCVANGPTARIYVRDTGKGIAADELDRIFDDFVQLDNAARARGQGYGLGLAIAKRVADIIGCPIGVASTLNEGSTFWIDTPLASNPPEHLERSTPPSAPLTSARVLLVEDDDLVGEAMELLLHDEGYSTMRATSCEHALAAALKGYRPDFIISDYRLSDGNGADLILKLRGAFASNTPGILLTGDTLPEATSHGIQTLHKPISAKALRTAISRL